MQSQGSNFARKNFIRSHNSLQVSVGHDCNNLCMFCMEGSSEKERNYSRKIIKRFIARDGIKQALQKGIYCDRVVFTSGEPTLNKKLPDYVKYAKKIGFQQIAIISNGRALFYKKLCAELIEKGANNFTISLHGHTAALHDALTRSPGSFIQTSKGLANLSYFRKRFPILISVSHVVNKINYRYIEEFLNYIQKYNVDSVRLNIVQPRGRNMRKMFLSLMPRYTEISIKLKKLYVEKRSLFESRQINDVGRQYVTVSELPLCCADGLHDLMGSEEKIILSKKDREAKFSTAEFKMKKSSCKPCKYFGICDGVFKEYIKVYGWDEFAPIAGRLNK